MKNRNRLLKIGLGTLLMIALLAFVFFESVTNDYQLSSATVTPDTLTLNHFHVIQGTSILVATIERENQRVGDISARWFSFVPGYAVSNMAFLDGGTLSSHLLFENNDYSIIGIYQFPTPNLDSYAGTDQVEVKWLVYEVVESDTNDDGEIDDKDESTVAISDVDGHNYTGVLVHITSISGIELLENNTLVVVCERLDYEGKVNYIVAKIDLTQKKVIKIDQVVTIPLEKAP